MKRKILIKKYILGIFLIPIVLKAQEPCIDYTIDANLNDDARLMISAFHQTIAKTIGGYVVFGEDISPLDTGSKNITTPTAIVAANGFIYTGEIVCATVASTGTQGQGFILTTTNLYRWGENGIGYVASGSEDATSRQMQIIDLPGTLTATDITRVESTNGLLSLLTTTGDVYIKSNSPASAYMYGDGSTVLDNDWHQASISNVKYLKHDIETVFAYTTDGKYYTWGAARVYLGNGTAAKTNQALPLVMDAPFTGEPKMIAMAVGGAYLVLNNIDKKIYSMGTNFKGILGQGLPNNNQAAPSWGIVKSLTGVGDLENVIYISATSRSHVSSDTSSVGAITTDRTLYLWGANDYCLISDAVPVDGFSPIPIIPTGFIVGQNQALYVENGGHVTPYIDKRYKKFGYVGHCYNGSMGVPDCSSYVNGDAAHPNGLVAYNFLNTPEIDFCVVLPPTIDAIRTNPMVITPKFK